MSEEELKKYWGKRVKITSKDNEEIEGLAAYFTYEEDSDSSEASITIEKNYNQKQLVEVMASEIKAIEILS